MIIKCKIVDCLSLDDDRTPLVINSLISKLAGKFLMLANQLESFVQIKFKRESFTLPGKVTIKTIVRASVAQAQIAQQTVDICQGYLKADLMFQASLACTLLAPGQYDENCLWIAPSTNKWCQGQLVNSGDTMRY